MTLLAGPILEGTASVNNIAAVGGSSHVTAVGAPHAVPMMPKLQGLVVGAKVSDWVEHSFLYVKEEKKMSPTIRVTIKAEQ
jgi:hypothetical protein